MENRTMPPVHPGEVLKEEFLIPLGMSANNLAVHIGVPSQRIYVLPFLTLPVFLTGV